MADKLKSKHDKYDSPSTSGYRVKEERMDIDFSDEDVEPPSFVPAALGLQRVGTELPVKSVPSGPVQKLNARGMPTRMTKKNRLIFFDDFVEPSSSRQTMKKTPKILPKKPQKQQSDRNRKQRSPTKIQMSNDKHDKKVDTPSEQSVDVRAVHKIGMRLKNLLQLPKSYKWVCFEFFYSNIDKVFFEGTNDFMTCVKECFPRLNSTKLTRMQWCKIRRKLGKPRRSSPVFFTEERKELERKRGLIRYMQQKKTIDTNVKDLTNDIPMQLVVGTKVTAWLWKPYYGLFTGFISAIDTSNYTYRIVFDAPRIGTHSVPDFEVLSNEPPDTLGLPSNSQKFTSRNVIQDITSPKKSHNRDSTVPYPLLENIVKLRKVLQVKKTKIDCLKKYNTEAEMKQLCGQEIADEFKIKYARIVSDLEEINKYIQGYLNELQKYCYQLDPDVSSAAMLVPSHFREACHKEASLVLEKNDDGSVKDKAVKELITDLTALLFQVQGLSKSDQSAYGMSILQGSMDQIKDKLAPHHRKMFECNVEVHMRKIQMGLGLKSTSSSIAGSSNNR